VGDAIATNHLGHFALTLSLHNALAAAGDARAISRRTNFFWPNAVDHDGSDALGDAACERGRGGRPEHIEPAPGLAKKMRRAASRPQEERYWQE
jgi:hypothetical protein